MRAHKHTDLADSSAALIADLNRPGDLSLSLTHTRHTSFFFPPLPVLSILSSRPNILCFLPVSLCITLLPPPLPPQPSFAAIIQVTTSCLVC